MRYDTLPTRLHPYLEYGDQNVRLCMFWREPTEADVRRALKRAIKRHDKVSIKAGQREAPGSITTPLDEFIRTKNSRHTDGIWGKDLLKTVESIRNTRQ